MHVDQDCLLYLKACALSESSESARQLGRPQQSAWLGLCLHPTTAAFVTLEASHKVHEASPLLQLRHIYGCISIALAVPAQF